MNVTGTWIGSVDVGNYLGDATFGNVIGKKSEATRLYYNTSEYDYSFGGNATSTTLNGVMDSSSFIGGFSGGLFYPAAADDNQDNGVLGLVSFDGSQVMTWNNTTLLTIGADSFNNTLAWTSSEGGTNTIFYTTGPLPVPEPSGRCSCCAWCCNTSDAP